MTKIDNISDVNLSAVEDIGNIVFKSISTALNLTLLYFCHVLNNFVYSLNKYIFPLFAPVISVNISSFSNSSISL